MTFINGVKSIVTSSEEAERFENYGTVKTVERPKYEIVEEKKELLKQEEIVDGVELLRMIRDGEIKERNSIIKRKTS